MLKIQRSIKLINDCDALYDETELINAMLWYSKKPLISVKKVSMHGEYPAVSIGKEKIHIHRLLMMYRIKTELPKGYYVHHEDQNRLNNAKENLSLVYGTTHQSNHNKNKFISEYQKQKVIEFNQKRKGIKRGIIKKDISYQKIWGLYKNGYSINKISKILNYDWNSVKLRINEIHDNPELLNGGYGDD